MLAAIGLAALLAACAEPSLSPATPGAVSPAAMQPAPLTSPPAAKNERAIFSETGLASWYGQERKRHATASGERLDMKALTAAHPKLPFGTIARVTNLRNGRTVKVKINDRGPHGRAGRVVDVSVQAAHELDMHDDGIAKVKLQVFASDQTQH